ncbi:glycoside hydrolase N-terminal domain-containing protein [Plantactinospora sp. S1510]|uniref:Glycoside hydrolase N-terminal domain-containing protein n=1 Tax=Plantactinospora alkalitolerans TaxID=2789879 RepID=A0ABS0H409_9ACTN|nr:glycoside hydrolase N-terminal domain-containing protein [Plantactinospora alkalitolerans]
MSEEHTGSGVVRVATVQAVTAVPGASGRKGLIQRTVRLMIEEVVPDGAGTCHPPGRVGDALTLWYDEPAVDWQTQALPIGNGALGAMVAPSRAGSLPANLQGVWRQPESSAATPRSVGSSGARWSGWIPASGSAPGTAPGVEGRPGQPGRPAPARVAPVRPASGGADLRAQGPRAGGRREDLAERARRRRHRLIDTRWSGGAATEIAVAAGRDGAVTLRSRWSGSAAPVGA